MSVDGASRRLNIQLVVAPQSGAYSARSSRDALQFLQNTDGTAGLKIQSIFQKARPNRSFNRTLHSMPAFGLAFHASPNTVLLFRAG